ncbi:MAG: heavy metal translocating P-type ATPase [Sphingomonadaceae bacterium]
MNAPWPGTAPPAQRSLAAHAERTADGGFRLSLFVDGVTCGGCVARIERALRAEPGVTGARLNLSTRRLDLAWDGPRSRADALVARLAAMGHAAVPWQPDDVAQADRRREQQLLLAFGVAAFALANVMMLAWAVWLGHAQDMGPGTRAFFHWLQALIAVPAILWAGRPFWASASAALRRGRTNMDVPIAAGVLLTTGMSLVETVAHGPHVYFDGALALLSVLLLGRWLDSRMRGRTRSGVQELAMLAAQPVRLLLADGRTEEVPAANVRAGQKLLVATGERVGADGVLRAPAMQADTSLVTGEWAPRQLRAGDAVQAGMLNLGAPVTVEATAAGSASTLFEMVRLLEAAEQKQGRHVALADRAVRFYTPVIHALALATFLGWLALGGVGWQQSLVHAVCVLIIACPCALGLAVPAAQVAAAGRLLKEGVLLASETALERAAAVDTLVLDKTGTLTLPGATIVDRPDDPALVALASSLAAHSRHPLAQAIRALAPDIPPASDVREEPGAGLVREGPEGRVLLGSAAWCGLPGAASEDRDELEAFLVAPGHAPARFALAARARPDAEAALSRLRAMGVRLLLVSGDREAPTGALADALGIEERHAGLRPQEKAALVEQLQAEGRRVLVAGDGLNDAPALAAADASLAPGTAADASRRLADAVWMGSGLAPVATYLETARRTLRIVRQNIGFSFLYNALWVPVAIAGLVTPWIAAAAMAASSLLVTLNAARLAKAPAGGRRLP